MRNSKKDVIAGGVFDVLLFDGFSNHCLANTIEPLRAANTLLPKPLYSWRFLTLDGQPVHSSSGLQVTPHGTLKEASGTMLMVMPSYGFRAYESWDVRRQLRIAARRYRNIAGFDTGSWLLARAGLLDGHRATIHWEELMGFAEAFPEVEVQRERFIIDRDRITCSGAMAAFDLILHLIEQAHGAMLAVEIAQMFMTRGSARAHAPSGRGRLADRAATVMQENLEAPLSIQQIARRLGTTQRTLETRLREQMGMTPQMLYRRLRLNLARKLVVETGQPVSEIAGRCGYENASAMTRAFRSEFESTPSMLRKS